MTKHNYTKAGMNKLINEIEEYHSGENTLNISKKKAEIMDCYIFRIAYTCCEYNCEYKDSEIGKSIQIHEDRYEGRPGTSEMKTMPKEDTG